MAALMVVSFGEAERGRGSGKRRITPLPRVGTVDVRTEGLSTASAAERFDSHCDRGAPHGTGRSDASSAFGRAAAAAVGASRT
ncbi:MAG: hypothetical protein NTX33_08930 [Propionibacteriales bacterium]|nr:hypothetical protein [Propionibacteriales bacterium]